MTNRKRWIIISLAVALWVAVVALTWPLARTDLSVVVATLGRMLAWVGV